MYVFIGASTDTFFGDGTEHSGTAEEGADSPKTDKEIGVDEATHKKMVLFGLCLSTISMSLVSHFVKKELYKIFDKQKREKSAAEENNSSSHGNVNEHVEMSGRKDKLLRRPRGQVADRADSGLHDEEKG